MNYIENMKLQIEKQTEKEDEFSAVKMVGRQLAEIVGCNDALAKLVCEDFANGRTVQECEKKLEEFARKHKKGNVGCCPPNKAEEIIRKFYGLGAAAEQPEAPTNVSAAKPKVLSLADLL